MLTAMKRNPTPESRDRGLKLIPRINRWMAAGAVGLAGLFSVLAAESFHGHTSSAATSAQTASSRSSSASSSATTSSSTSSGYSLQSPSQSPSSSSSQGSAAVSGGS